MQLSDQLDMTDAIDRYLAGQISVSDLQVRLAAIAWDVLLDDDTPGANVLYELELGLADFSNGDWTEDELKGLFLPLLPI